MQSVGLVVEWWLEMMGMVYVVSASGIETLEPVTWVMQGMVREISV